MFLRETRIDSAVFRCVVKTQEMPPVGLATPCPHVTPLDVVNFLAHGNLLEGSGIIAIGFYSQNRTFNSTASASFHSGGTLRLSLLTRMK